jgi:hypothetical protein
MPKKKISVDKPRSESAQSSPENDETVVEFVFGLGDDATNTPTPQEGAPAPGSSKKKTKKQSVFFKFTNNPG